MEENNGLIDISTILIKMFQAVKKSWKGFLLFIIIASVAGIGYVRLTYRPLYENHATFAITRELNGETNYQYNRKATDELSTSFASILKSSIMMEALCDELQMNYLPATLESGRIGTTNLFTVTAKGKNQEQTTAVLNAFMSSYPKVFKTTLMDMELTMVENPTKKAVLSNHPAYESMMKKVLILGIACYLLCLLVYVLLRRTISEEEDVYLYLRGTCLGSLPFVKSAERNKAPLITSDGSRYFELKDAIRSVRRQMEQESKKCGKKVFMFTGAMKGEGTSTVAANVALSLAEKGYATALWDLDLRIPSQLKMLPIEHATSGPEIPLKDVQLESYSVNKKLHVYGSLKPSSDVSEILSSDTLKLLFEKMMNRYDFVLIDAPPTLPVEDAPVLSKLVDAIVFVIKEDGLSLKKIIDSVDILTQNEDKILGFVINGSKHHVSRYNYGYNYSLGYGYYGYGSYSRKKELKKLEKRQSKWNSQKKS